MHGTRGTALAVAALFGLGAGLTCSAVLLLPMLFGAAPAEGVAAYAAALLLMYGVHAGTRAALHVAPEGPAARIIDGLAVTAVAALVVALVLYALYRGPGAGTLLAAYEGLRERIRQAEPARPGAVALLRQLENARAEYLDPLRQALARAATLAFFGCLVVAYGALRALRAARTARR